jgi:hypothetical protein
MCVHHVYMCIMYVCIIYVCRFCLASSSIKVHLIVSVGEAVYLSLPRGK